MESSSQTSSREGFLHADTLILHLLGKCNLTCFHCYMDGAPTRHERLALGDVLGAIEDCRTLGITSLSLTGGEPLLYPELRRVLQAASAITGLATTLSTNATLLSDRYIDQIARLGVKLNVSVDGGPEFHDAFRRESGAFVKTEQGIKSAVKAGISVTVIMTVSRGNQASIAAVADWAFRTGVTTIRFQPLLPLGRGIAIAAQGLSPAEINDLIIRASDLANQYKGRLKCRIIGQTKKFFRLHPCAAYVCNGRGCHRRVSREIKTIAVRENGTILPEAPNLNPRFAMGQLGEARLATIFTRFMNHDYNRFDALCRGTYTSVLPNWEPAIVPWDQILSESSYRSDIPPVSSSREPSCSSGCEFPPLELA
jgi:Fe-coproporphyrin III synthase